MADNESLSSIMAKLKKKRETLESNAVNTDKSSEADTVVNNETVAEDAAEKSAPSEEETADVETAPAVDEEPAEAEPAEDEAPADEASADESTSSEAASYENAADESVSSEASSDENVSVEAASYENASDETSSDENASNEADDDIFASLMDALDAIIPETRDNAEASEAEQSPSQSSDAAPSGEADMISEIVEAPETADETEADAEAAREDNVEEAQTELSDDLFNSLMDDIMSPSADESGRPARPDSSDDDLFNSLMSEIKGDDNAEQPDDIDDNVMTTGPESETAAAEEKPAHADDDLLLAAFGYSAADKATDGTAPSAHRMPKSGSGAGLLNKTKGGKNGYDLDGAFAYEGAEYRERAQKGGVLNSYDREKRIMYIRLACTFVLSVLLLIFDIAGKKFGGALNAEKFPVVNIMISLQLLLVCAVVSGKTIIKGVTGIISTRPTPASVTSAVVILTVLYDILIAVAKPEFGFSLYNSPAAFCLLSEALAEAGELFRQADNFRRMSSWESVCTLEPAGKKSESGSYSLTRGTFAESYFKLTNRVNTKYHVLNYVIAPVLALALIMMIITLAKRDSSFQKSLNVFIVTVQFSLPSFVAIADLIPFLTFCFRNTSASTVLLHENDTADFESVKSVVLDETDMFGDGSLKIVRIRMCENSLDVYSIMTDTTAICGRVGGTISSAFKKIADETEGDDTAGKDVIINRVVDGGIDAYVNGRHYIVGSVQFLSENNIVCKGCDDGRYIEVTPRGAVFHIAVDGIELVRLYMEYTPGRSFTDLVDSFRGREINIELHCVDPNINDEFVAAMIGNSDVKVNIVRETFVGSREKGRVEGGLLADGDDWLTILETAGLCSQYRNASKLNFYIMAVFAGVGVLLSLLLGLFGASVGISPLVILAFKLVSLLPSVLTARIYLK